MICIVASFCCSDCSLACSDDFYPTRDIWQAKHRSTRRQVECYRAVACPASGCKLKGIVAISQISRVVDDKIVRLRFQPYLKFRISVVDYWLVFELFAAVYHFEHVYANFGISDRVCCLAIAVKRYR